MAGEAVADAMLSAPVPETALLSINQVKVCIIIVIIIICCSGTGDAHVHGPETRHDGRGDGSNGRRNDRVAQNIVHGPYFQVVTQHFAKVTVTARDTIP